MKQALFDHLISDAEVWRARAAALRLRCAQSTDYALCERLTQLAEQYDRYALACGGPPVARADR
jgi:hypothetical protein